MKFTTWLILRVTIRYSFPRVPLQFKLFYFLRLINREMRNRLIGFIIAGICAVILITLCICYHQSRCCFRNVRRKFQNQTHTTPPSNQTVRTVTGNVQPMTCDFPIERYPSQSQTPPPYYDRQPAYNPGKSSTYHSKSLKWTKINIQHMEPISVIPTIDTSHQQAYYANDFQNADMTQLNWTNLCHVSILN